MDDVFAGAAMLMATAISLGADFQVSIGQTNDAQPGASAVQTMGTPRAPSLSTAAQPPAAITAGNSSPAPAATYLQRQSLDCADFKRGADGSWAASRAVILPAPEGPLKIEAGSLYRPGQFDGGYDLGAMLEHDCSSG